MSYHLRLCGRVCFYILFLFLPIDLFAQINSYGTEFWLCFQKNYRLEGGRQNLDLEIFITAVEDARVKIQIEELGFYREIDVPARRVVNVSIPPEAEITSSEVVTRKVLHIVADNLISVYGLNRRPQSTDTYLGLPTTALGTEYRVVGYTELSRDYLSQFAIIAIEDKTEITITPTSETLKKRPAGKPFTIQLNKGEAYQVIASYNPGKRSDLTGSHIKSNKPIAVFSGHSCAYVPRLVQACNHLVEQVPPLNKWGKHFYIGKLARRTRYTIRVVAGFPNTKVFENDRLVATLDAGEFYENSNLRDNVLIASNNPVLVAQYAHGSDDMRDRIGDPMMILITPTQQFLNYYQFATPVRGTWRHYINIVVPRKGLASLRLDGKAIDTTIFERIGVSEYMFAHIQVPYGTHVIQSDYPFGVYSYGLGYGADDYDAYGNAAGQSFEEIVIVPDTLAPIVEGIPANNRILVVVRDDRTIDWGLKSISLNTFSNLRFSLPKIDTSAPQAVFEVFPIQNGIPGTGSFIAEDVAGNKTPFTICYQQDLHTNTYQFTYLVGSKDQCPPATRWKIGAFAQYNYYQPEGRFSTIGDFAANGIFSTRTNTFWGAGIALSYRWKYRFEILTSLHIAKPEHYAYAPDSLPSRIWTDEGYIDLHEATILTMNSLIAELTPQINWYFAPPIYAYVGFSFQLLTNNSASIIREIISPANYVYENNSRSLKIDELSIDSQRPILFGTRLGIGAQSRLWRNFYGWGEIFLFRNFNSTYTDAQWLWKGLRFRFGVLTILF